MLTAHQGKDCQGQGRAGQVLLALCPCLKPARQGLSACFFWGKWRHFTQAHTRNAGATDKMYLFLSSLLSSTIDAHEVSYTKEVKGWALGLVQRPFKMPNVPSWRIRVQFLAQAPDSSFLLVCGLGRQQGWPRSLGFLTLMWEAWKEFLSPVF